MREESPRVNRSKAPGTRSGARPGPSSCTDTSTPAASGRALAVIVVPGGVWRAALLSRFATTWCSRPSSPSTATASSGRSRRQAWSGATTRASATDSSSRRVRSTSARSRGRPESSRASSSRSSTRSFMRPDWSSTRDSAASRAAASSGVRRASWAYPAMVVSGVRSSCDASATNLRTRCSLACRCSSELSTWPSRVLRAAPTCPTSVRPSARCAGTRVRRSISPLPSCCAATASAVAATCRSGRSCRRTISQPVSPASSTPRPVRPSPEKAMLRTVRVTSPVGRPTSSTAPSGPVAASTR